MQAHVRSRSTTPNCSRQNQAYETSYRREFALKRVSPITESPPFGQRFLVGSPFQLNDPVGNSLYAMDFAKEKETVRETFLRPNTNRANRPHPHKEFPYWPRRSESLSDLSSDEIKQTLRNQLNSTYQVDYTGAPQGFELPLAYDRSRPYWRQRAKHTLDSEYRKAYQDHPQEALFTGGRYACSNRVPVDAIVPQTLALWKKKPLQSIYAHEISQKTPSELHMRELVDSLSGPMDT